MSRLLIVLLLCLANVGFSQVRLNRLFSDHVVLQRQKPIPVWGWAQPKETVKVTLAGQTQSVRAAADGSWKVLFKPLQAGGPHTLSAQAKSGRIAVNDVLIGEVWLCSGQSNIEWPVAQSNRFAEEKINADFPQIRHFKVEHEVSLEPKTDLTQGEWQVSSPETVGGFTAIGFFFARELYQKLKVPIGLVHSSWGGSQIEGWISKEGMAGNPEFQAYAQRLPKTWEEADAQHDQKLRKQLFKREGVQPSRADEEAYLKPGYDFSSWHSTDNPIGQWDWKGIWAFRGQGYMARVIELPAEARTQETTLVLAENDSPNDMYINGTLVSKGVLKGVRSIKLPAGTWQEGANRLVIKFGNLVHLPWFGLGLEGSTSDLYVQVGNQKISLFDQWKLMPSFAEPHTYVHLSNNVATSLYNAMIAPLVPFGMRGTLWYQGETNAGRAYQYREAFPLLITDWRKKWQDEFSFYFVQLSSYGAEQNSNQGSNWAELREAQTMTLRLPKTGMAVTTDVGNPKDIHPTNKQDVGHRLASEALVQDFNQPANPRSPLFTNVQMNDNQAVISFKYADPGLEVRDKYGYLKGFEVAGDDHVFHYAKAEIKGNTVVVSHPKGQKIASVRYGWADSPVDANLYGADGFPVSPFRTDDWPGGTVKAKFE